MRARGDGEVGRWGGREVGMGDGEAINMVGGAVNGHSHRDHFNRQSSIHSFNMKVRAL